MPLRHAAPNQPQLPGSLNVLAKEISHRPPDFLSGHAAREERASIRLSQEADTVHGICDTHRGHEAAEVRDARRTVGGHELRGSQEKEWMGWFPDDLRAFGIKADQWTIITAA